MPDTNQDYIIQIAQFSISAIAITAVSLLVYYLARVSRNLRFSHSVAVLGYPRSGKTTLIVTIIYRIISSKLARNFRVTGDETIEKVTSYRNMIVRGVNIGPTGDDDTFLYRFQYDKLEPNILVRILSKRMRTYDIAIGDFPGEYTSEAASGTKGRRRRRKSPPGTPAPSAESATTHRPIAAASRPRFGRLYDPEYHSWVSQADKYIVIIDSA